MGRRSLSGGVRAAGPDRIEFTFVYQGKRYRPTILRAPTETNLRRARQLLIDMKERIRHGTFNFREEFPDYKHAEEVPSAAEPSEPRPKEEPPPPLPSQTQRTCGDVFDAFLDHCEMRVATHDMAYATLHGYRKILNRNWRPKLGSREFTGVMYSELVQIAASQQWRTKKTYNNGISPLRCAFEFGYKDHPQLRDPAEGLDSLRIKKQDRPKVDPFSIQEAEALIGAIHFDWGEAQGNYDEFRFFTGLRPSEEIALEVDDCDLAQGTILVSKARVMRRDNDRTKTSEERLVELCPRALDVLKRQLALRAALKLAGHIHHENVFFRHDGSPIRNLNDPYDCWRWTLKRLKSRYRPPYNARHSSASWYLMVGKNLLWVAKNNGHSPATLLKDYAAWIEGAKDTDIEAIRQAIDARAYAARAAVRGRVPVAPPKSPEFASDLPVDGNVLVSKRTVTLGFRREMYWWKGRESNPRPRHYECRALTG